MRRAWLSLLILLSLGGCAGFDLSDPFGMDGDRRVTELVQAGEYGKALSILDRKIAREPENEALKIYRDELQRRADRFEQTMLIEAAAYLRVEDWPRAQERYDHALSVLPDSAALIAARNAFEVQRQDHLRALRTRLLLTRAHGLIRERPMYEEIHRVSPNSFRARQQYQRAEREAREMAVELLELGETALSADDPLLAVEALTLAHALAPEQQNAQRLESAESARRARLEELRTQTRPNQDDRGWSAQDQDLLDRYHAAFRANELVLARQLLNSLLTLHPGNEALQRQRPVLNRAIDTEVSAGLERGLRLYSQGRIQEALDIWRPLRTLAPEHRELEAHVERAERVLKRLDTLR